jgi:hypothetical protein
MGVVDVGSDKRSMFRHFDSLLRDCAGPFKVEGRSLVDWTAFGHAMSNRRANYTVLAMMTVLVFAFAALEFVPVTTIVAVFVPLVVSIGLINWYWGEWTEVGDYRSGRGYIKRYSLSVSEGVERVHGTFTGRGIPFRVFDVTLGQWPGRPRATLFETTRSGLVVTLFKDGADLGSILVHVGRWSRSRKRVSRTLMRVLDEALA